MPLEQFVLADTEPDLAEALDALGDPGLVGVDVERADWNRYYRAAALIQVGGQGRVVVVDPLALRGLECLQEFLSGRLTVLHAMENDLVPLAAAGVVPPDVEDTSVAAAVLGLPTGLEALLREVLGVELDVDKQAMQRADWEARPIEPRMLAYAAGDVADLPALWEALATQLREVGRLEWYRQELVAALALPPAEERRDWSRTRGAGRLGSDAQARLHALWGAREALARQTDTAPGRIAGDKTLIDLATNPPQRTNELGRRGMRRQAVRDFGEPLLEALHAANGAPPALRDRSRPVTEGDRTRAERLRALRARHAKELGIEPGILCPSRTLVGAVTSDPATPAQLREALGLRPWQWEILADDFCAVLEIDRKGRPTDDNADRQAKRRKELE